MSDPQGALSATLLRADQVARFHEDGFAVVDRLIDPAAVEELRTAYDDALSGAPPANDQRLGGQTRVIHRASQSHPVFASNAAVDAARQLATQILGRDAELTFDMLVFKPPGHLHETSWHQDAAFIRKPTAIPGLLIPTYTLMFWVALDDVDPENGCMHFLPGYHRKPLLAHEVVAGDPYDNERLLAIADLESQVDLSRAVAAPLAAGGCTIHGDCTPHYTPGNRSTDRPRRAYVFHMRARGHQRRHDSHPLAP